ncbi:hypothetical protein, partial [Pseudogemmobacter hezensis]|uniref:hypothetical protein n=1 Tax=Pseudogemmobacter hezensis TaxID=2737662 RepID=UPI001C12DDE8
SDPHRTHEPLHITRNARDRPHALKITGKGVSAPPSRIAQQSLVDGKRIELRSIHDGMVNGRHWGVAREIKNGFHIIAADNVNYVFDPNENAFVSDRGFVFQ